MMEILLLIIAMVVVGLIIGAVAGWIWKDNRPYGASGDYLIAIAAAVIIGLIDWFVIPAMGFSESIRNIGLMLEPALGALLILWLVRVAKR
jgi:uncharacterized membrane protein YeaQ/YmgE (transglycosylase-associated protein family)